MEMTNDLLGNDLFLINETEEELINSLKGCYNRMLFFEKKRNGSGDLELIEKFKKRTNELMSLKIELLDKDIEFQKKNIKEISAELKIAEEMEKSRYNQDFQFFNAA